MEDAVKTGTLPPRRFPKLDKYGDKLDTVCSYCNFKHHCYDGKLIGFIASGRPQYYTSLNEQGEKFAKDKAKIGRL